MIHDIDPFLWQKMLSFPPFSLKLGAHFLNVTNLKIMTILMVIRHNKHVFLVGIRAMDNFVWPKKLFLPPFSIESMFIDQKGQTWILVTITIFLVIGHYKHILLIEIHDIKAFVWQGKLSFLPFSLEKVHPSNRINMESRNNLHSIGDWAL